MSEQSFAASGEEFDDLHGYAMLDSVNVYIWWRLCHVDHSEEDIGCMIFRNTGLYRTNQPCQAAELFLYIIPS